jgi:hypothetical protein
MLSVLAASRVVCTPIAAAERMGGTEVLAEQKWHAASICLARRQAVCD